VTYLCLNVIESYVLIYVGVSDPGGPWTDE
jgi:hypothetical protein